MEKVIESLKNLYRGENIVKKHLMFALLLLLPAIAGGAVGIIDKDTPQNVMIVMAVIGGVLFMLSIIPYIFMLGFYINFVKDRLVAQAGIPQISGETFMMGVRALPLCIVWGLYFVLFFGTLFIGPIIPIIMGVISSKPDIGAIIFGIILLLIAYAVLFAVLILVVPFVSYVFIEYVEDGKASGRLFNPFVLIGYMKKAFKDTILVELKFILVGIITSLISGVVTVVIVLFSILVGGFAVLSVPSSQADVAIYSPLPIIALIILSALASIVQFYVSSMVGYAAAENYIGVYKDKIIEQSINE